MSTPEIGKSRGSTRVLLVDDDPGVLRAVERILGGSYDVSAHSSAQEALDAAREIRPDIAVIDVRMPEMDGFTLQKELIALVAGIDVILMTGSMTETDELLIRALREGAFYFILKPFRREVLEALVERCVESRRLRSAERRNAERMQSELISARALQQAMLAPVRSTFDRVDVRAAHQPCTELGGDFFDYYQTSDGVIAFILADVRGHGAPAALLTALVRSSFRSPHQDGFDPASVVERLVGALAHFPPDRFATVFCGALDRRARLLCYCNAGHPPALIWSDPAEPQVLEATGPLASSIMRDAGGWNDRTIALADVNQVLVYSDGVTDQRGPERRYGDDHLVSWLAQSGEHENVPDSLVKELDRFRSGRPWDDDVTILQLSVLD